MEKFACKDMGINCNFVATAATKEDVKKAVMKHAQEAHKDMLAKMTPAQIADMSKQIDSKIKTV